MSDYSPEDDDFDDPGSLNQVDYQDILGHTVLVIVRGVDDEVETKEYGTAKQVPRVDLVDLDDETEEGGRGRVYEDVLLFGQMLSRQLKNRVGRKVLGVFSQGEAQGKKSPPWIILPKTDEDITKARKWQAEGGFTSAALGASSATSAKSKGKSEAPF